MTKKISLFLLLITIFINLKIHAQNPANRIPQPVKMKTSKGVFKQTPSLIPLPQSLKWSKDGFSLNLCETIVINDTSLQEEANRLLTMTGRSIPIKHKIKKDDQYFIQLKLGRIISPFGQEEAYHLIVRNKAIILTANTPHGIFNGLQTLYQLISNNNTIRGCEIADYPAYQWRGYMVDVGRNYQSPEQLKQQIDIMSRYKLNVFHFHLTEDIAWRLQIKQYPQLTVPENMLRNKGQYYNVSDMKELIQYCRDRYITLVPEIDMPGHSQAFTRAMGMDMQSEKGLVAIKNILREFCRTYDLSYIHIGADEVQITNKNFIPEVECLLDSFNRKVIGWNPGTSDRSGTIQQLWKDNILSSDTKYIDSRFMYISDMDPQNTVVSIFNRKFFDSDYGDKSRLGAEVCLWSDRRVFQGKDLLTTNPVYPAILAFAERTWRGGGYPGHAYYIGEEDSQQAMDFEEFEGRLLSHKQKYFQELPFVYVKQTHIKWKLFGPFDNNGNLTQSFYPENENVSLMDSAGAIYATGGTLWLRHVMWPVIKVKAWLPDPKDKSTWYAFTRFWSNETKTLNFWIDFKDQSRSGADATPPANEWDYNKSKIWINKEEIAPPSWKFPGRPSGLLEDPLVDEAYYYRPPHRIKVNKGWNEILVKLPVNDFDYMKDWQVPPKYMFTVIPVYKGTGINWEAESIKFSSDTK